MKLETGNVHLWIARCSAITDSSLLQEYQSILSSEELDRQQRYKFEKSRHRDLVTRVLLRTTLSRYHDINASEWCFDVGENGKPEISAPASALKFNLSHAGDFIVLAITQCHDVGVDIEYIHRKSDYAAIAERYFSHSEIADLSALPVEARRERFYDYWTLKEAYLKGRGLGLAASLAGFGFHFNQDGGVDIMFYDNLESKPDDWRFWRFVPDENYRLALAIRCGRDADISISMYGTIPLTTYHHIETPGM